jgi:hypothetical protein
MRANVLWPVAAAALLLSAGIWAGACDDGGGGTGLDDGTGDADTDGDADGDADACTEIAWGSGLAEGAPVANWSLNGYLDGDFDGVVEEEAVDFTLEDMNCLGFNSVVLMIGDTG